jgi:glucokinase
MTDKQLNYLGIDLGASSVKYGIGNCQQGLLSFSTLPLSERSLPALQEAFGRIIGEAAAANAPHRIAAIGIGTPGTINLQSGRIAGINPNLPFWVDHSPRELLPEGCKLPVYYDNDANLMTLGEAWMKYPEHKVIGITVGSGIGCGFVDRGEIYRGGHGYALELGHVTMIPGGELCNCGRKGCLEAYTSVDGLRRRIAQALSVSAEAAKEVEGWNLAELIRNEHFHPQIRVIREEGRQLLAQAVANLIVTLDPDVVLFGGGGTDAGLYPRDLLRDGILGLLPRINRDATIIGSAEHGNRAGVLGAVVLAARSLERNLL